MTEKRRIKKIVSSLNRLVKLSKFPDGCGIDLGVIPYSIQVNDGIDHIANLFNTSVITIGPIADTSDKVTFRDVIINGVTFFKIDVDKESVIS